jgi:hypothetical protein
MTIEKRGNRHTFPAIFVLLRENFAPGSIIVHSFAQGLIPLIRQRPFMMDSE